jgi:hypothetical protein
LLILGEECVAADLKLQGLKRVERLALCGQNLAGLAAMGSAAPDGNVFVGLGNCRKGKDLPVPGLRD